MKPLKEYEPWPPERGQRPTKNQPFDGGPVDEPPPNGGPVKRKHGPVRKVGRPRKGQIPFIPSDHTIACVVCATEIPVDRVNHDVNRRQRYWEGLDLYCSRTCFSKTKTKKKKHRKRYGNVRQKAQRYHELKCSDCGIDIPGLIELHHKDNDPGNNEPDNLIFLCANHHRMRHLKPNGRVDHSYLNPEYLGEPPSKEDGNQ